MEPTKKRKYQPKGGSQIKKAEILRLIKQYWKGFGCPPTYRWLGEKAKCSESVAWAYVKHLVKDGKVELFDKKAFPIGFRKKVMELANEVVS